MVHIFWFFSWQILLQHELKASDKSTRGRPQTIANAKLNALYGTKLCISAEKKKDLVSLCTSGIIPSEFHQYYKNLPSNKKARDVLPDSDIEDDDNVNISAFVKSIIYKY
jgi:hypothetical protein